MRESLDCAVLIPPDCSEWVENWVNSHRGQSSRLRFYTLDLASLTTDVSGTPWLSHMCSALRRFDCCILPVSTSSLSWTRTALASAETELPVPLVALAFDIAAPALLDLLSLGVADFVRTPVCLDELRARLVRLRRQALSRAMIHSPVISSLRLSRRGDTPRDRRDKPRDAHAMGDQVQEPWRTYMEPSAVHLPVTLDASMGSATTEPMVLDIGVVDEPFRQAKARMIDGFERAYLRHALLRYAGNVAQAARASSKHRRAFWALMRKHQIDAAAYRDPLSSSTLSLQHGTASTQLSQQPG